MYAILLTTLVVLLQPPTGQPGRERGAGATPTAGQSLDGTWTVVAFEKNGQPVPNGTNMTAMVRNNVLTFAGGTATNRPQMMRLETSVLGGIRVSTPAPGPGAGIPPGSPPAPGAANTPPNASSMPPMGTVVHTRDYLVIALRNNLNAPGPGIRQGTPGAGTTGTPAPGASPPPSTGTGRPGPGNIANTNPGAIGERQFATVLILKRSGSTTPGTSERK